jgi:hypothetical protein
MALLPASGQPTLPNGLQLVRFEVRAPESALAGASVVVEITLANDSGTTMKFDPEVGVFVGARVNSTSNDNNRDFGHAYKGLSLAPGRQVTLKASTKMDTAGEWRFWPAYRMNGNWGPFRWMEKTVQVYATAADARRGRREHQDLTGDHGGAAGPVFATLTVAQLLANPSRFEGKRITVTGDVLIVRAQKDSTGNPWTLMSLMDVSERKKVMNVIGTGGHAPLVNGDVARATGVFRMKSQRGRYTYDNELICESRAIVKDTAGTAQKLADEKGDTRKILDMHLAIPRQFNLSLLQGRLHPLGSEIRVQFPTRTYSQTPRRNTVVAAGLGSAAVRVERTETRPQIGGPGSSTAGAGMTFMVVWTAVRGSASNRGMPENFGQSIAYYDAPPVFALVVRGGSTYRPDPVYSTTVNYYDKGTKPLGDIAMNSAAWTRSGIVFKVPKTVQDPILLLLVHHGGGKFEYTGVKLY